MNNPAFEAIKKDEPFVYFHTHVIDESILESAIQAGKSLEVDMSVDKDDQLYVGHPENFYTELKKIPLPDNLPLDEVLEKMKKSNLYLVIDCTNIQKLHGLPSLVGYLLVDCNNLQIQHE